MSQYTMGVTGGLNIPSADMQGDGTFMAGGNYLPKELLPDQMDFNSGNYFVNLTFFPFAELAYRCTFLRGEYKNGNKLQQDRSVSVRLRPLKEGAFWPSVVVGSNDVFTTGRLNAFKEYDGGNRYFSSVYAVMTKHLSLGMQDVGFTLGYNLPFKEKSRREGVFAGMSYTPSFMKNISLMAEYDAEAFNVGFSGKLFNHFSIYALYYDLNVVAAGIRYEFVLIH